MIIALNGYSGVGKDAVGTIIQYLTSSNKGDVSIEDVIKDYKDHQWWLEEQSGWEIKKFAGKLKEIAEILTGIPKEKFEDQEFKKTDLSSEWDTVDYSYRYNSVYETGMDSLIPVEITEILKKTSVRDFLQRLGTDALRNKLHPNVWVNALLADYTGRTTRVRQLTPVQQDYNVDTHPNWIITDCRFLNEAIAIKNKGGVIIRIDRPGVAPINDHPSEVELDDWNFDYKIANVSDLTSLVATVETILKKVIIL